MSENENQISINDLPLLEELPKDAVLPHGNGGVTFETLCNQVVAATLEKLAGMGLLVNENGVRIEKLFMRNSDTLETRPILLRNNPLGDPDLIVGEMD